MKSAERTVSEVRVPGDKSISHRALILASIAEGTSAVRGLLLAEDVRATAGALRALGVDVPQLDSGADTLVIHGVGLGGLRAPRQALDCGNSGTAARLLLGLLAGAGVRATLSGDLSLRSRPIRRVTEPLVSAGARFRELGESDRLPVRVEAGTRMPVAHDSPRSSAQVKSALLLAGLGGGAGATVTEPVLSRDHTERMLRAMGADVRSDQLPDGRFRATIAAGQRLGAADMTVPGDMSSAAFFLAAAVLSGRGIQIPDVGVNPGRTGLLDVLERMGAQVRMENARHEGGEPVADLVVPPGVPALRAVRVTAAELPTLIDEVPVLAVLAAGAHGETTLEGIGELRVKETDRVAALVDNLRALGADSRATGDRLAIRGRPGRLAGRVQSRGDHRIAMAFGALNTVADHDIEIDTPGVAAVSYPDYWTDLERYTDTRETP